MMHNHMEAVIQTLHHQAFEQHQLSVSILRTDLIHPVISGNKWMKLQPWIKRATALGTYHIITKGGPWSNHLHAAAFTAQQEKFSFTAVVKAKPGFMTATLNDILQWKGNIIYTDHEKYIDETYWENLAFVQDAIYVPMGGEGEEAVAGVTEFFNTYVTGAYDCIVCPVGTGTTYTGLAFSSIPYQMLLGIDPGINDKNYEKITKALEPQFPGRKFKISGDAALGKFGKWPDFLPTKMNGWFNEWQLPTDIIYTAKMMAHFEQLVAASFFDRGCRILLVHTGGLQGNRSLPSGVLTY